MYQIGAPVGQFRIIEAIAESYKSELYRAEHAGGTVRLKALKSVRRVPAVRAQIRQEYAAIRDINCAGVVRALDLIEDNDTVVFVHEDYEGVPLLSHLRGAPIGLDALLRIAARTATVLGEVHRRNVVHRDIKPHNIIITGDLDTDPTVLVTDFGIGVILDGEIQDIYNLNVIKGRLPYLSPEQTGRMNRPVDYRTDLYSLGIVLYELATGTVPFRSTDPLVIIHSHMAKDPVDPARINPELPPVVSRIILRLLAKGPEDRYQNALGLAHDLEECIAQRARAGRIADFTLCTRDISERFNLPQKIFGRQREIAALLEAFGRVSEGSRELVLVSGPPGIGKTMLIHEIHKPIVSRHGYFFSGKFDQLRRDVPYSSVIQAFQSLVRQILAEGSERVDRWRQRVVEAVDGDIGLITALIPELEHLVGAHDDPPALAGEEALIHFQAAFRRFTGVFARAEHPLAVFLDDMQWADPGSLALVGALASDPELSHLFFILSYRNTEVGESHPLMNLVSAAHAAGVRINALEVPPLSTSDVNDFAANFLRRSDERTTELASLVHRKTGGNPFFINQFLKTLYEERYIRFDPARGWSWDIGVINAMMVSDNVVEFMLDRIARLPEDARQVLKICACIGNRFELETVAVIIDRSLDETLSLLGITLNETLISAESSLYRFFHDRIQEAAYAMLTPAEKGRLHYRIGRLALERTGPDELRDRIFYIVDHLNYDPSIASDTRERRDIARLNLIAGRKSSASAAYDAALHYYGAGISLLDDAAWSEAYDLAIALHVAAGEACYLTGAHGRMDSLFQTAFSHARSPFDLARAHELLINRFTVQHRHREALAHGLAVLAEMGLRMPARAGAATLLAALVPVRLRLLFRRDERIMNAAPMSDERVSAITRILMACSEPCYLGDPAYLPLVILRLVSYTLRYGTAPHAAYAFVAYGVIISQFFGDSAGGYRFGELAMRLQERSGAPGLRGRINFLFGGMIIHWRRPLADSLPILLDGYRSAIDSGDLSFASYNLTNYLYNALYASTPLPELIVRYGRHLEDIRKFERLIGTTDFALWHQLVCALMQTPESAGDAAGHLYHDPSIAAGWREAKHGSILAVYGPGRLALLYCTGRYDDALREARILAPYQRNVLGQSFYPEFHFLYALAACAAAPSADRAALATARTVGRRHRKWAHLAPGNYLHRFLLIQGELSRVTGSRRRDERGTRRTASELYERALDMARRSGHTRDSAIVCECAGRHHLRRGNRALASLYLAAAAGAYAAWGAASIADNVRTRFGGLLAHEARPSTPEGARTLRPDARSVDLATIMKTSQALTSEIDLGNLLRQILEFAIENAGASYGALILEDPSAGDPPRLVIRAQGGVHEPIRTMLEEPVDTGAAVSASVVNYVYRTRDTVILGDAGAEGMFATDPVIIMRRAKSVLCAPIVYQQKLSGIIYLENSLAPDVFTPERLELLGMLSAHAAISIENALLLDERERTARLRREMEIAANIQRMLLPAAPALDGFEIAAHMQPAENVGGDYYDIITERGVTWIIIGDVSGHGLNSGLVMMMVQTAIHVLLRDDPFIMPDELLTTVNRTVSDNLNKISDSKYMTITALRYDADGAFVYSGLHLDIIVRRAATRAVEAVKTDGRWIGFPDEIYPAEVRAANNVLRLSPGDTMLLYTDGVTDAIVSDDRRLNIEGLMDIVRAWDGSGPRALCDAIVGAVRACRTHDDVTLLAVRRLP